MKWLDIIFEWVMVIFSTIGAGIVALFMTAYFNGNMNYIDEGKDEINIKVKYR